MTSPNPYRLAAIPGDRPTGPDAYLDRSEAELFKDWKEMADHRAKLCEIMKGLTAPDSNSTWAFISSQLTLIDSQMNGILIARAFQRLRLVVKP